MDWTKIGNDSLPPGYVVEQSCVFRSVGGGPFIFSPTEPDSFVCVHPKGTATEVPKGGRMPANCSRAPDQTIYCFPSGTLSAKELQTLYDHDDLPTP